MEENNMIIWDRFSKPPKTALKQISAGRLKGKTDINPQWRYKVMTEVFGVVGIGWKFTVDKQWTEQGAKDEVFVFVNVSVFVKVDGEWSDAIHGNGGSKMVVSESKGMYNDDNAYKKATTDALSTAMKMLGVAADIYAGKWNGSKYADRDSSNQSRAWSPKQLEAIVNAKAAKNAFNAKAILDLSNLKSPNAGVDWCAWYGKAYRKARESGLSVEDAAERVNASYIKTTEIK